MLKTQNHSTYCASAADIDSYQHRLGALKRQLHLLHLDECAARKGGGFKELSMLACEREEVEGAIEFIESELAHAGVEPSNVHYLADADESELQKLSDYYEHYFSCDEVALPTDIGGDF